MHPYPGRWILIILLGLGRLGAAPAQPVSVVAVQVRGTVDVQHDQATTTEAVTEGAQLGAADTITTGAQSSVMLVMPNGSVVALKEKSRIRIAVALQSPLAGAAVAATDAEPREPGVSQTSFELAFGNMLTRVRKLNPTSTFTVQTPVSVAAVRGTVFEVSFQPGATGEAQYRLTTASGLVHVTPHAGRVVAVPASEQVDLSAEIGKNGVKIKQLKSSKLERRKQDQMQRESLDNERNAGELMRRLPPAGAGMKPRLTDKTEDQAHAAGTPPRDAAKDIMADKTKPGAGKANSSDNPANRVTPPATPPTKPKIPVRPKIIKRPPRRPGG